jgi:acyl-CoA synthetase (NDP forming)
MKVLDPVDVSRLSLCFTPESAAIIGASTNPMKFGGRALKFCLERGYGGRLYPVNAQNDVVQGVPAFRSVADLPKRRTSP